MPVRRPSATANTWIPQYRPRYDEFLAGLAAMDDLRAANFNNAQKQFREKFLAKTGDGGNRASWDPALRERELDNDGIAAEVDLSRCRRPRNRRRDLDAVRHRACRVRHRRSGAGDGRRAGPQPLARRSVQRESRTGAGGIATVPIIHDVDGRAWPRSSGRTTRASGPA